MVEVKSSTDRQEERRIEEKKNDNRRDVERRMQYEPMKTFEAKLAEKAAHEITTQDSALRQSHDEKQTKEEKQSLMDKIIGVAKDKGVEEQKARVAAIQKQAEEQSDKKDKKVADHDFDSKKSDKTETNKEADKKSSEYSSEGHKRVAEKSDDQTGDGAGGFGSGAGTDDAGTGDQSGEFGFGQQSQQGQKFDKNLQKIEDNKVAAVSSTYGFGKGTFDSEARDFTPQNLDDMVTSVQLGINEYGEEQFLVELGDEYFDGLSVQATRTDEGIVVTFICPNIAVRSTFLMYRPKIYFNFVKKNIDVKRIDVV